MISTRPLAHTLTVLLLVCGVVFAPMHGQAASRTIPMLGVEGLVKKITEEGKGKVVVMTVFASWCPPCREEMPMLVETRKNIGEDQLMVIGLSSDESIGDLNSFIEKYQVNFPVFTGTGELFQVLGISGIPHMFIFNRRGELVESVVGLIPEAAFKMVITQLLSEPDA